jgi:hypothetical protein
MNDLKQKLAGAQWRLHLKRTITVGEEELEVVIRRPPEGAIMAAFAAAQQAGEVDAERKPTSDGAAVRLMARMTALCLFAPGGLRPLFAQSELDTLLDAPWLLELQKDVTAALSHGTTLVEVAKGNSDATPSSPSP